MAASTICKASPRSIQISPDIPADPRVAVVLTPAAATWHTFILLSLGGSSPSGAVGTTLDGWVTVDRQLDEFQRKILRPDFASLMSRANRCIIPERMKSVRERPGGAPLGKFDICGMWTRGLRDRAFRAEIAW